MRYSIARMITFLARKSQGYIGSALSKYNLTAAEQPFFMALQHNAGITQEGLTTLVGVDKAATARAVKSLEEKGFLIRIQDEQDRRQNLIYATDAAKQISEAVRNELLCFNDLLIQGISEEELEIIHAGLMKMANNLSALSDSQDSVSKKGRHRDETNE
ncbi:MAG: MarR family winged helix-turn-helix transcriptional regulator [Faecousia sp.]